ncbi:MAG: hypothetical protein IT456_21580 [Planctomycetes bacterium]|nr:hypothetical protein [Planctomycetota bacterium]
MTALRCACAASLFAIAHVVTSLGLPGQCATAWEPGDAVRGVDGSVMAATMWDADGPGPLPERLVLGGTFLAAGSHAARALVLFDPATGEFAPIASSLQGFVHALQVMPNGDLIVAGNFTSVDGVTASSIARFDGASWSPIGTGIAGSVAALAVLPNGDLVAGGQFLTGQGASHLARFDGTAWVPLGAGPGTAQSSVASLLVRNNGDLVAGGLFYSPAGLYRAALWNGSSWAPLWGLTTGSVLALAESGGELVAGGTFGPLSGSNSSFLAKHVGGQWVPAGLGTNGPVYSMHSRANGDLVLGGAFTSVDGVPANHTALWNGSQWSALGSGIGSNVMALSSTAAGGLYAGGSFSTAGSGAAANVAAFLGTDWHALGSGESFDREVRAVLAARSGELFVAGTMRTAGASRLVGIARRSGSGWGPLGAGVDQSVLAMVELPNGDLVAGGEFTTAGGQSAAHVARWDGANWSPLGAGLDGPVHTLAVTAGGALLAGGSFAAAGGYHVARWDGTQWSALGGGANGLVRVLQSLPNGDVLAGGDFTSVGGVPASRIALWNGSTWSSLGAGLSSGWLPASCHAMTALPNGDLLAGGSFLLAGGATSPNLARWNGVSWSAFGGGLGGAYGPVYSLLTLPNGEVLAGGERSPGLPIGLLGMGYLVRGSGGGWTAIPEGPADGPVRAMSSTADGEVVVGGFFTALGGAPSPRVGWLRTTCRALAVQHAAGCPSSGGNNALRALNLPWSGSTFRAEGTGLPASALVFSVTGFGWRQLPLASVLSVGQPGCDLRPTSDLVRLYLSQGGAVTTELVLPNTSAFAGVVLYHQLMPWELDAGGAVVAATATDSLALTIGHF